MVMYLGTTFFFNLIFVFLLIDRFQCRCASKYVLSLVQGLQKRKCLFFLSLLIESQFKIKMLQRGSCCFICLSHPVLAAGSDRFRDRLAVYHRMNSHWSDPSRCWRFGVFLLVEGIWYLSRFYVGKKNFMFLIINFL